jgi:glutamine cyclotransferase
MATQESPQTPKAKRRRLLPIGVLLVAMLGLGGTLLNSSTSAAAPVQKVRMVRSMPHDPSAFCQGLVVHRGGLLEGTGQYGESRLRLLNIETGRVAAEVKLADNEFGEGVTVWQDRILQLTWKRGYLITYDANTMQRTGTIPLRRIDSSLREGWGITHDGRQLIISDGTSTLRFVDPQTMRLQGKIRVRDGRRYVSKLNELEYVNGEILANVWYRDQIARIDPKSGRVIGWLELKHLRPREVRFKREAVLNGIAWDAENGRLFVTGKNWPTMYEVSF